MSPAGSYEEGSVRVRAGRDSHQAGPEIVPSGRGGGSGGTGSAAQGTTGATARPAALGRAVSYGALRFTIRPLARRVRITGRP